MNDLNYIEDPYPRRFRTIEAATKLTCNYYLKRGEIEDEVLPFIERDGKSVVNKDYINPQIATYEVRLIVAKKHA